jgi:ADP-heptose:LPS heptosyltransferase
MNRAAVCVPKTRRGYRYAWPALLAARLLELCFPCPPLLAEADHSEEPKILFLELFGLGDVASLSTAFGPLLYRFPRAKIYILCQPWCASFYEKDSRVFQVVGIPTPWKSALAHLISWEAWASVMRGIQSLKKAEFDWCIETRGDIRSQILARWIRPKRLVGPCDYMGSNMILRGKLLSDNLGILPQGHRYQRNCDCLLPLLGARTAASLPSLPHRSTKKTQNISFRLLLHPVGGWKYKHWPEERWRSLLLYLLEKKEWEIGLLCGPGEENAIERITQGIHVRVEKPKLSELLSTIQSYGAMVATDSGPIHLAILSGIPVVNIMGPGDSSMWAPPTGRGILLQSVENYPCHPCLQRKCVFPSNPCIRQVALEEVKSAVEVLMTQARTRLRQ